MQEGQSIMNLAPLLLLNVPIMYGYDASDDLAAAYVNGQMLDRWLMASAARIRTSGSGSLSKETKAAQHAQQMM